METHRESDHRGIITTTRASNTVVALLGAEYVDNGVALTRDEVNALKRAYGFEESDHTLTQEGNLRNMFRLVERDGLRVTALMAQYLERDQDPVDLLIHLLNNSGYDTTGLVD